LKRVVLFGTGLVAEVAQFFLTYDSTHEVIAFTVDGAHIAAATKHGLPIVPFEEVQTLYPPDDFSMFISIGYQQVNKLRESKYHAAKGLGYDLVTYVSSKATMWPGANIGDNCLIMESNVIHPFTTIGNNVVICPGCLIGHHSVIGDHCYLSPHVAVSGNVTIEPNCLLGVGSTIRDGMTIARECVIGAGSLVMQDTQPREVYVAQRAELLRMPSDRLPPSMMMSLRAREAWRTGGRGASGPAIRERCVLPESQEVAGDT
jgi:sugar O-acyltransferase (sialic acid O-acetyltransferase NeuD family)